MIMHQKTFALTMNMFICLIRFFSLISVERTVSHINFFIQSPISFFFHKVFVHLQTLPLFLYIMKQQRLCVRTRSKSTSMGAGILMLSLCKSCGLLSYTTESFKAKYAGLKCGQRSLHSP
jgi:hypothetical protein